ncbi:MAG: hypothetical protein ACYTF6_09055 [Planctomycetota bacterium]|jgi:hypothetical protein
MSECKIAIIATLVLAGLVAWAAQQPADSASSEKPAAAETDETGQPEHSDRPLLRRHRGEGVELTESQKQELLEVLKKRNPERFEMLMKLEETNPQLFSRILSSHWRMYQRWKHAPAAVQEAWAELVEIRAEIGRTLSELRAADDAAKPQLIEKLRGLLAEQLDDEHIVSRYRLTRLQELIEQYQADLKYQSEHREEVISRRLHHLLEATRPEPGQAPATVPPLPTQLKDRSHPAPPPNAD